jgi:hypothetical protein
MARPTFVAVLGPVLRRKGKTDDSDDEPAKRLRLPGRHRGENAIGARLRFRERAILKG